MPSVAGLLGPAAHLAARVLERIEVVRKSLQAGEVGPFFASCGNRPAGTPRTRDRLAHLLDQRQRRLGASQAVDPDDVGAGVLERLRAMRRGLAVRRHRLVLEAHGDHHRQARLLRPLDGEERLAEPRERLADDEVDPLLHLDRELLVEGLADAVIGGGAAVLVHPGQREISRHQAAVACGLARDPHGRAVQVLEPVLEADGRELVAAGVERQRLQDLGARLAELDVELLQRLRPGQRDLGRERAGAHPAALLELEQISPVAQDGTFGEPFEESLLLVVQTVSSWFHVYAAGSSSPYSHSALIGPILRPRNAPGRRTRRPRSSPGRRGEPPRRRGRSPARS